MICARVKFQTHHVHSPFRFGASQFGSYRAWEGLRGHGQSLKISEVFDLLGISKSLTE